VSALTANDESEALVIVRRDNALEARTSCGERFRNGRRDGRQCRLPCGQRVVERRALTQAAAATLLGLSQPKVSALRNYKLAGFSVERLMNLLTALDQDIEIVIRQKPRSRKGGRISVVGA